MRFAATLFFVPALLAQAPTEKDLFAADWRARNDAARALAAADWRDLRLTELLDAVDHPVDESPASGEWFSSIGFGGGAGGRYGGRSRRRPDPSDEVLSVTTDSIGLLKASSATSWNYGGLHAAKELVVPWHTCELATWLIEHHVANGATWRADLARLEPTAPRLARLWWLGAPDDERVQAALADAREGGAVAELLHRRGEDAWRHLRAAMRDGPREAKRRVVEVCDSRLFDAPELVDRLVEEYVDEDDDRYHAAAKVLVQLKERTIAPLAQRLQGEDYRRHRAVAMLAYLRQHASPAVAELAACVGDDEFATQQALVALAACEIAPELRGDVARRAMAAFRRAEDEFLRTLACDVLARCGDGVDAEMRAELQQELLKKPGFLQGYPDDAPRLLACLSALDAVPEMPIRTKVQMANKDWANLGTWRAVAAHGGEVAPRLLRGFHGLPSYEGLHEFARLLVTLDADLVARDLQRERSWRHGHLLSALLAAAPERVTEEQLVALALAEDACNGPATQWLAENTGAKYARQVLTRATAGWSLSDAEKQLLAALAPTDDERLELLAPQLRRGQSWELVASVDAAVRRERCLAWLADAEGRERTMLLVRLIELGLQDADVERVRAAIERGDGVLYALRDAPALPARLRSYLSERVGDNQLDVARLHEVREVLLAHARRD